MTTQTEAERLADCLETHHRLASPNEEAAAELRRLVSFNNQLIDEVTRLQKREWVGLTDDQIGQCIDEVNLTSQYGHHHFGWHKQFARAIEATLKEKNHG